MRFSRFGTTFILRIDRGEEIVAALKTFCTEQKIALATVQGIGAVDNAVIGLFEAATQEYLTTTLTGDHEITSLLGNLTTMDGKPYLHLHVTLTDSSYRAIGGHLTSAIVSGTCEIFVAVQEGRAGRRFDPGTGLNVLDL